MQVFRLIRFVLAKALLLMIRDLHALLVRGSKFTIVSKRPFFASADEGFVSYRPKFGFLLFIFTHGIFKCSLNDLLGIINCRGFCRNFMLEKTMYVCISSNIVVLPRVPSSHSLVLNVLSIFALKEFNFVKYWIPAIIKV